MKDLNYKYDFYIPKTFVIGLSKSSTNAGFPSMKTPDSKWTNVSVFENICGFKPWTQRSEEKEINKALNQAVDIIENVPITGFKIVDISKDVYSSMTNAFNQILCATLQDPRGWNISVSQKDLQNFLEASDFNVKNGEIVNVKLMYAWKTHGCQPFKLVVADEEVLEMQRATESMFIDKFNAKYIKPKEFEVGKVYSSCNSKMAGHKYMYMGIHDVYSNELHENALMSDKYDIDKYANDRNDSTSKDMHVFYCIDFKKEDLRTYNGLGRGIGVQPYFVTKSISKLFENVSDAIEGNFTMHNSAFPVKYETIVDDMSKSAMFNLIDLNSRHLVDCPWHAFKDLVGNMNGYGNLKYYEDMLKIYPFDLSYTKIIMHCDPHGYEEPSGFFNYSHKTFSKTFTSFYVSIGYHNDKYQINAPCDRQTFYSSNLTYFERPFTQVNREEVLKNLHDELNPKIFQYKFTNGNDVPIYQSAVLNDVNIKNKNV